MTIPIPEDSILRHWYNRFDNTEIWPSWRIAVGLGIIGASLERNACFSYGESGMIWPNTSVMLIGKSGDGKDTIIKPAEGVLEAAGVSYIPGTTIEAVKLSLYKVGNPAVGYICAKELSAFIGGKDYQQGIVESLTDILSNSPVVDITVKGDLQNGGKRLIHNPTLTMFAGTTPDWLPEDCLAGGFLGRFVVAAEFGKKPKEVPNPGDYETYAQRKLVQDSKEAFGKGIMELRKRFTRTHPRVFSEDLEAKEYFANWYHNRFTYFSASLESFANRAGNLMRKVAMLMAVSRGESYISKTDYEFASGLLRYSAERLERGVIPASKEVAVGYVVLDMLPMGYSDLLKILSGKYSSLWVKRAVGFLIDSGQAKMEQGVVSKKYE